MNKILAGLVLIFLIVVGFYYFNRHEVLPIRDLDQSESDISPSLDPSAALLGQNFSVPGVAAQVVLKGDMVDYEVDENKGSVVYIKDFVVKFSPQGREYIVAPIAVNTGGSGTFVYLVLFKQEGDKYQQMDEILLGDRIKINKISVVADRIKVFILDRLPDEPMAAVPTVEKELSFGVIGDLWSI